MEMMGNGEECGITISSSSSNSRANHRMGFVMQTCYRAAPLAHTPPSTAAKTSGESGAGIFLPFAIDAKGNWWKRRVHSFQTFPCGLWLCASSLFGAKGLALSIPFPLRQVLVLPSSNTLAKVNPMKFHAAGTMLAAALAIERGWSINL
eukprot:1140286-Pelagomonas_calceolata.AAC.5